MTIKENTSVFEVQFPLICKYAIESKWFQEGPILTHEQADALTAELRQSPGVLRFTTENYSNAVKFTIEVDLFAWAFEMRNRA